MRPFAERFKEQLGSAIFGNGSRWLVCSGFETRPCQEQLQSSMRQANLVTAEQLDNLDHNKARRCSAVAHIDLPSRLRFTALIWTQFIKHYSRKEPSV